MITMDKMSKMFNKQILMACFVRNILEIGGENTHVDFGASRDDFTFRPKSGLHQISSCE